LRWASKPRRVEATLGPSTLIGHARNVISRGLEAPRIGTRKSSTNWRKSLTMTLLDHRIPMHKQTDSKSFASHRALRAGLLAGLLLAMLAATPLLRSQTMPDSPSEPTSDWATHDRLKKLVPERVGKWKLFGTGPEPMRFDVFRPSGVLAEFRCGKDVVKVNAMQGDPRPVPVLSAPVERNDAVSRERAYNEGGSMVNETYRLADGRTDVDVVSNDGVIVSARSYGVPASELKAIAMGIKAAPR
jgi:hypothetical protein